MRGRPKGEPTEQARLCRDQARKLNAIARKRGVTVRRALEQVAGALIDHVYKTECRRPRKAAPAPVAVGV